MHRIGVISDTHGLLRPRVREILQGCEAILHGGDFGRQEILEELTKTAPVYAVRGNNDDRAQDAPGALPLRTDVRSLPETLSFELYGVRFFMTHDKKEIPKDTTAFDIVIYGHSHKYEEICSGSRLFLNPGSCGPKRFTLPVTMAVLEIAEDGSFRVKRIDLMQKAAGEAETENPKSSARKGKRPPDMKRTIKLVVRDTEKGIPVSKIADRHGLSGELAEQICRLYLTHPGVDADGIMRKMGL